MRPTIEIPIEPVPKPRMTKSDRWKKRPATTRYWEFKDNLHKHIKGDLDPRFDVTFYVSMPKSWSKKVKENMDGKPHQQKPDVDNFTKAFMDALCVEDSYVYDVHAQKYWAKEGKIILLERGQ